MLWSDPTITTWHDRVDEASVSAGVQEKVGDGKPMTARLDDVKCLEDINAAHNQGGQDNCLLILVGREEISESIINKLIIALTKG